MGPKHNNGTFLVLRSQVRNLLREHPSHSNEIRHFVENPIFLVATSEYFFRIRCSFLLYLSGYIRK